ncbi:hypothetical protein SRHO_G00072490 [Serrasalmus rhombeus]
MIHLHLCHLQRLLTEIPLFLLTGQNGLSKRLSEHFQRVKNLFSQQAANEFSRRDRVTSPAQEINACSKEPTCVRVVAKRATVRTRLLNTGRRGDDTAASKSATKIQHDRQVRTIAHGRHSGCKQRRSDCVEDATFQAIQEVLCHNRQVKVV